MMWRVFASTTIIAAFWYGGIAEADPAAGESTFGNEGCGDCHYTDGPAKEKTIEDQLAKRGPELWYAGSKFQQGWLEGWLQDPQPIRPLKYNSLADPNAADHPSLDGAAATNVAEYLMTLTSDAVETGLIAAKKDRKSRMLFIKEQPCSACHQYPAKRKVKGGMSGPSLVGAGTRLNPDWIYAYLVRPEVFKPIKMMPVFRRTMTEDEMQGVAAYIATFE